MNSDKYPYQDVQIFLSRLNEIATGVMHAAEAHTLEQVLERIAHVTRDLIDARYAALGVPDGRGGLRYFKTDGMTPEEIRMLEHPPYGHGLLGAVMRERETVRLEHISTDPRSVGFPENHPMMDRFLGAPIQTGDQLFGMLYLCDRRDGQPFQEEDEWLVETIAGYAALAIAGSHLRDQQSRLRVLEERERIGMAVHDGIIQALYAVGMHRELLRTDHGSLESGLKSAVGELNQTIDDIRDYIMDLKRQNSGQRSIRDCLLDLTTRLHVPLNIRLVIDAPDTPPLFPSKIFDSVCQIVNEALSNALRHASPTRIIITGNQDDQLLTMSIVDNGIGFDAGTINPHHGLGLWNMHQRARRHGGEMQIESTRGEGTRVTITVPVQFGSGD